MRAEVGVSARGGAGEEADAGLVQLHLLPGALTADGIGSGGGPTAPGSITQVVIGGRAGVPVQAIAARLSPDTTRTQRPIAMTRTTAIARPGEARRP